MADSTNRFENSTKDEAALLAEARHFLNTFPETVLDEAKKLVYGARQNAYGHPFDDFSKTATLWSPILGVQVTPEQVALCMIQVKISRLLNTPEHHDSQVDIAGYVATYELVRQRRMLLAQQAAQRTVDEVEPQNQ